MKTAKRSDWQVVIAAALLLGLAACAAPSGNGAAKAEPVATTTAPAADSAAPPHDIAAAITDPAPAKGRLEAVDDSCRTDADCTVKDVGNCCGAYPQCVNVDSPTFPDQVKAACAATGQMGVCGFPSISGCQCVAGKCAASNGPSTNGPSKQKLD